MVGPVGTPAFTATRRDLVTLPVGLAVFWFVYSGPPFDELRFGLAGPASSTPWKWLGALLLLALVCWGERRRLASLLLTRPTGRDVEWGVYALGFAMTWSWLAGLAFPRDGTDSGTAAITALGVTGVVVLVVTAAVTEEIAFRGYLAERFAVVLRSRWWGAAASFAVFVAPHLTFFGPSWLLHHLGGALALALLVLLRRNLVVAMGVHLLVNAPILIPTITS